MTHCSLTTHCWKRGLAASSLERPTNMHSSPIWVGRGGERGEGMGEICGEVRKDTTLTTGVTRAYTTRHPQEREHALDKKRRYGRRRERI